MPVICTEYWLLDRLLSFSDLDLWPFDFKMALYGTADVGNLNTIFWSYKRGPGSPGAMAPRNHGWPNFRPLAPTYRVAQKTGPSYLIANIPKTPWPNCVEILQIFSCLLTHYSLLWWRHTGCNFILCEFYWNAAVVYSHCTNRFEHHTVAVFSLGGATARWNF